MDATPDEGREPKPPRKLPTPYPRIHTGEIPWSFEEFGEAIMHAISLRSKPHDDWDRTARGVNVKHRDGTLERLVFNPDAKLNQICHFLMGKFKAQGLSKEAAMSHMWRFIEAMEFMAENDQRLRAAGLIIDDFLDPKLALVSGGLIKVLATAKYDGVRLAGPEREPVQSFHLERVIAEAKQLDAEDLEEDDQ